MSKQFDHGYALLIGVNENEADGWALPDVAKDVKGLKGVLTHPGRCAYSEDHVKVVTEQEATRQGILGGLRWLRERIQADTSGNATAVVYYTGHGLSEGSGEPSQCYLVPYDFDEGMVELSALRATDFARAVRALKPQRLLVVLDCCHAGGMGVKGADLPAGYVRVAIAPAVLMEGEKALGPEAKGAKGLETLAVGSGRAVLSSSTGKQRSFMRPDGKMSIFTYHLIEALTGHAQPKEGATEVLVSDVMSYVYRRVPESAKAAGKEQVPDFQVSGNFAIALLLGGKGLSKGERAPDPLEEPTVETARPTYQATVTGDGAIAQGERAAAAGTGGTAISGDVGGDVIIGREGKGR
jgi:uncharacterized caspase-like protein